MSLLVRAMFYDGIAPTYDTLNRVLSLGIDQSWRRRAMRSSARCAGGWWRSIYAPARST